MDVIVVFAEVGESGAGQGYEERVDYAKAIQKGIPSDIFFRHQFGIY